MNKKVLIVPAFVSLFTLFGCGNTPAVETLSLSITNSAVSNNVTYSPSEVTLTNNLHDIDSSLYLNSQALPSTGEVKILVLPVLIPGDEVIDIDGDGNDDKEQVRSDIERTFFGEDDLSVASFYKESSFGKLSLTGVVDNWFNTASLGYTSRYEITADVTLKILNAAIANYKSTVSEDLTSFDSDSDGYIDGVWLIYSSPNYLTEQSTTANTNLWAYTSWTNQAVEGNVEDPIVNLFGWASYDFMYSQGTSNVDAHTYIHETGHFLGLMDYYSTDSLTYAPLGKLDMMDANIIDHNNYSKMLLGWIKPTLVYGNAEIDLASMANEDSLIVLQSDTATVSSTFNPFGEYIALEVYTIEGTNSHDVESNYSGYHYPRKTGLRIYHIDKRAYKVDSSLSLSEYDWSSLREGESLVFPITNSRDYDNYNYYFNFPLENNLFDEIRLIEQSGEDTFTYGGYQRESSYFYSGDSFSISSHSVFFKDNKLNNSLEFSYKVEVK